MSRSAKRAKTDTIDQFGLEARVKLMGIVDGDGSAERLGVPDKGYIRWMREGRKQTLQEVADRMGIKPQSLAQMETAEPEGRIKIETLRLAAQALGCTFVYALVPNEMLAPRLTPDKMKAITEELAELARRKSGKAHAGQPRLDPLVIWEGEKSPL